MITSAVWLICEAAFVKTRCRKSSLKFFHADIGFCQMNFILFPVLKKFVLVVMR